MVLPNVILADRSSALVAAWREAFDGVEAVRVHHGDFFDHDADALVSPANSFGIMDGGLDLAIRHELGHEVERAVQRMIVEEHHGEMPIGVAAVVPTGHARWPYLVVAPTMRVPETIGRTLNPHAAFRAVLLAVRRHSVDGERRIRTIVCSGLGTGIGDVEPRRCAAQMRVAWAQVAGPARIPSFAEIRATHQALRAS